MQILIQYMKNTNVPLEEKIRFYESLKKAGIGVPKVSLYFSTALWMRESEFALNKGAFLFDHSWTPFASRKETYID